MREKLIYIWLHLEWLITGRPELQPHFSLRKAKCSAYIRYFDVAERWLKGESIDELSCAFKVSKDCVKRALWKAFSNSSH